MTHWLTSRSTRNINNNIDFGLSFPTSTNAPLSKTPSTSRRASSRATKTPARRSVSVEPAQAAVPVPSTARRASKRKSSFLDAVTEGSDPPTSKKRRLNDSTATSVPSTQGDSQLPSGSQPYIIGRRSPKKSDFIAIAEESSDEDEQAPAVEADVSPNQAPEHSLIDLQEDKENHEPSLNKTQNKRRKRKSIGQRRAKKRSSTGSLQDQEAGPSRRTTIEPETRDEDHPQSHITGRPDVDQGPRANGAHRLLSVRHQDGVAIPTKAPRTATRLEKEPDIAKEAPRTKKTTKARQLSPLAAEDEETDADNSILSFQSNSATKKRRNRKPLVVKRSARSRVSAQSTASTSPAPRPRRAPARSASPSATLYREADENEDETYIPEEVSPEPPTPAMAKKSRKNARIVPSIKSDEPTRRSNSAEPEQSGFPITTHRLSNISALPTITEENEQASDDDDDDDDDDHLQGHFGASRTAPNAVDVLAQICRETVACALASTRTSTNGSELKRRTEALESFGKEIDSRLFDMSTAVENRLTLEARVRTSKRKKNEMQSRWIEVRRKREEVALRMDRVRREHWESEEQRAEAWKLSEGLHAVEIAMEREKGTETESLEYLLTTVGAGVSGHQGGGVLQKVKSFNAQMERMVEVLEGRAE
jgi:hypothetical protein